MKREVLIVFSDDSLGGTSRSALAMGRAWRLAGFEVQFHPHLGVHPQRVAEFQEVGQLHSPSSSIIPDGFRGVVHYHHGAWSEGNVTLAQRLMGEAEARRDSLLLLTHNVFGVSDRLLDAWPGRRITGVLGAWAAAQYIASMGVVRHELAIVPNPQDTAFFRPPIGLERADAREVLGLPKLGKVVLRVGSPIESKWSADYVRIVLGTPDVLFVFVGPSSSVASGVRNADNVVIIESIDDDELLRQTYWAASGFLHIAARGESFGNVLLECLACGTPVVCLSRPYRDNTPWEFQRVPGFMFARSLSSVRREVSLFPEESTLGSASWDSVRSLYSLEAVSEMLVDLAEERVASPLLLPPPAERWQVLVRHNPLADLLKRQRLTSAPIPPRRRSG